MLPKTRFKKFNINIFSAHAPNEDKDDTNIWHINDSQAQQYLLQSTTSGYIFRLLRVILRPSTEQIQDCQITSALWDPVALTIGGIIVVQLHVTGINYSVQ
jgi:hypothetical protein